MHLLCHLENTFLFWEVLVGGWLSCPYLVWTGERRAQTRRGGEVGREPSPAPPEEGEVV